MMAWIGVLLAPAAFFLHLQGGYLLVLWSCDRSPNTLWIHLASIVAVAIAVAGLLAARTAWRRAGAEPAGNWGGRVASTRLLAAIGLGLSAAFVLLLLAQTVQGFVTPVCQ